MRIILEEIDKPLKLTKIFYCLFLLLGTNMNNNGLTVTTKFSIKYHNWSVCWKYTCPGSTKYSNQIKRKSKTSPTKRYLTVPGVLSSILRASLSIMMFFMKTSAKILTNMMGFIANLWLTSLITFTIFIVYGVIFTTKNNIIPILPLGFPDLSTFCYPWRRMTPMLINGETHKIIHNFTKDIHQKIKLQFSNSILFITLKLIRQLSGITKFIIRKGREAFLFSLDSVSMMTVLYLLYTLSAIKLFRGKKTPKSLMTWALPFTESHYAPIITIPPLLTNEQYQDILEALTNLLIPCCAVIMFCIATQDESNHDTKHMASLSLLRFMCKAMTKGTSPMFVKNPPKPNLTPIQEFQNRKREKKQQYYQTVLKNKKQKKR